MKIRFLLFLFSSLCFWIGVSLAGVGDSFDSISPFAGFVGLVSTLCSCLSLALQRRYRKNFGELAEYFVSLVGRTCAPLFATIIALRYCEDVVRREIAVRVLIGYFGVLPFHVWATIPSEKEVVERAKSRRAVADRCENGSYED